MRIRVRSSALLIATAFSVGIVPQAAEAHEAVGTFSCNATLNLAVGTGTTSCIGDAKGYHGLLATLPAPPGEPGTQTIQADVTYMEAGCPVVGLANGSVSLGGNYFADLAYVRVGALAAVVLTGGHTGAAVGVFTIAAADIGPGLCSDTNVDITLQGAFAGA